MWTEATLLDAAYAFAGSAQPTYLLRQVEVADRRIDGIMVVGGRRIAIEAKTNRADFRREHDDKREPSWLACHACVYLCPSGVIETRDLPDGWGLWYATGPAQIVAARHPLWHEPEPRSADQLASAVLRRAAATERRVRAAERAEDPVGALVAVSEEVSRLETVLAQQGEAVARERRRARDAAEQVAALVGDQVCSCCEKPIVYTRVGAWRHVDPSVDGACRTERAERERRRRMALTGAEYIVVTAPRITPLSVPIDC